MANEKRLDLIDRGALIEKKRQYCCGHGEYNYMVELWYIENAPTVDAVEVVRCEDCESWEQYNACDGTKPHRCMNPDAMFYKRTKPNDFCSYGERRTDNERKAD